MDRSYLSSKTPKDLRPERVRYADRPPTRQFKGRSGQLWCELCRNETHVTLMPDYEYYDSASMRGQMTIPIAMLKNIGMKEVTDATQ